MGITGAQTRSPAPQVESWLRTGLYQVFVEMWGSKS